VWRRAPQQKLRTHCSLKTFATLWWRWRERWSVFFFSFFQVTEHRWNEFDRGKPKYSGKKPVPVPLCPQQIPHGLTRDRTRVSAVGGRQLQQLVKKLYCVDGSWTFVTVHKGAKTGVNLKTSEQYTSWYTIPLGSSLILSLPNKMLCEIIKASLK
jgi:hypothetical protein